MQHLKVTVTPTDPTTLDWANAEGNFEYLAVSVETTEHGQLVVDQLPGTSVPEQVWWPSADWKKFCVEVVL